MAPLRTSIAQLALSNGRFSRVILPELGARTSLIRNTASSPWMCQSCQQRNLATSPGAETTRARARIEQRTHKTIQAPATKSFSHSSTLAEQSQEGKRDEVKSKLPSHTESRRSDLNKRLSLLMDHMQTNIFIAGQRLNDLTGYSGIETLKKDIEAQERRVASSRQTLQEAKAAYQAAINQRSASQREVNDLLQRKNSWSPQDLERFTTLYRSDHANEQAESTAKEAVEAAERASEEAGSRLSGSILARYHEEQIWSDKIRRMSTWGTWGLMGVNVLLFLVFQIGVEPWRRKRLVKGFEDKVMEALEKEGIASNVAIAALKEAQDARIEARHTPTETATFAEVEPPAVTGESLVEVKSEQVAPEPLVESKEEFATMNEIVPPSLLDRLRGYAEGYKASAAQLLSHEQVTVRRVDLTTVAFEGAFVGIAMTAIIGAILRS